MPSYFQTHQSTETITKATGQFQAQVALLDENRKLQPGPYSVQAFIFHASELADTSGRNHGSATGRDVILLLTEPE